MSTVFTGTEVSTESGQMASGRQTPFPSPNFLELRQAPDPRSLFIHMPHILCKNKDIMFLLYMVFFFNRFLKKRMPPQPKIDTYVTKNYTFPSHITAGRWYLLFNFSTHILKKILPENIFNQKVNILLMITYK